jgi:exoribonuclease R
MVTRRVAGAPLDFAPLRAELAVPGDFACALVQEAERAAREVPLPDEDATDLPLVTVDPAGSRDLDQALHLAREGDGYLVSYAIADVASFVRPGSALDEEAQHRGETLYFPDLRVPLYPSVLSEGAASLLPGQLRPAALWRITLNSGGEPTSVDIRRCRVRSTAQLDYATLQGEFGSAGVPDAVRLLPEIGGKRAALARARHAINLDLPAQEVQQDGDTWTLASREPLSVEYDNAQISLLTGMCAAQLMLDGKCGILRTLPPPDAHTVRALHRAAQALGIPWPPGTPPGDVLSGLDRSDPHHVVLIEHATSLLRGAGYAAFDGVVPAVHEHAGIAAAYAHVTAPLRRLVDRYTTEICLALYAGNDIPSWVRERFDGLPDVMRAADHRAHEAEHAVLDMTEAWLLRDRVGQLFDALVIDADEHAATITLDEPAVRARCSGPNLPVGERISARLVEADVMHRKVRFEATEARGPSAEER